MYLSIYLSLRIQARGGTSTRTTPEASACWSTTRPAPRSWSPSRIEKGVKHVVGYSLGAAIGDQLAYEFQQVNTARLYNSPTTFIQGVGRDELRHHEARLQRHRHGRRRHADLRRAQVHVQEAEVEGLRAHPLRLPREGAHGEALLARRTLPVPEGLQVQ